MLKLDELTKVVTHPLGLAAFVLFLVFSLATTQLPASSHPWLLPALVGMAFIALLGGLYLAYVQVMKTAQKSSPPAESAPANQELADIDQKIKGDSGINIVAGGNVTVERQSKGDSSK